MHLYCSAAMKKDIFGCLFSVIFAFGKLYCCTVIFVNAERYCASHSLMANIISLKPKVSITLLQSKISLHRRWNITKKYNASLLFSLPIKTATQSVSVLKDSKNGDAYLSISVMYLL